MVSALGPIAVQILERYRNGKVRKRHTSRSNSSGPAKGSKR